MGLGHSSENGLPFLYPLIAITHVFRRLEVEAKPSPKETRYTAVVFSSLYTHTFCHPPDRAAAYQPLSPYPRILGPVLASYFNYFMKEGIFPDILKIGRITPIYKNKGSKQNFNNYRPISILAIFGKIFEKIIFKRLYSFLTSQNLIYSKQFGFRKGHSTSHALNYSANFLTNSVANRNHTIGIFIDLSKAFDTIDHNKLLVKLDNYGIRGTASALIESNITGRKQYTTYNNEPSDHEIVTYGVPQGSVLGPLLFLMYINDIVNCSSDGEFVLYADDTNIFVVGHSKKDAFNKANDVIKRVHSYMLSNLLHINTSKCHYMYFKPDLYSRNTCARSQPLDQDCKLHLNGSIIKPVSCVKFLGVTIDENLTWIPHIENLKKNSPVARGFCIESKTQFQNRYTRQFTIRYLNLTSLMV